MCPVIDSPTPPLANLLYFLISSSVTSPDSSAIDSYVAELTNLFFILILPIFFEEKRTDILSLLIHMKRIYITIYKMVRYGYE